MLGLNHEVAKAVQTVERSERSTHALVLDVDELADLHPISTPPSVFWLGCRANIES